MVTEEKDLDKVAFSKGAIIRIEQSIAWINQHKTEIEEAVK